MHKSRFSEEQIVGVLREYAAGAKVSELCRKHGISDATLYKWKNLYEIKITKITKLRKLR